MTMLTSGMWDILSKTFFDSFGMKAKAGVAARGERVPKGQKDFKFTSLNEATLGIENVSVNYNQ